MNSGVMSLHEAILEAVFVRFGLKSCWWGDSEFFA